MKSFNVDVFGAFGLATAFAEEYVSHSSRFVLRGMHFQVPPHDHVKVVQCLRGRALDVALDLRLQSPTFGCCEKVELTGGGGEVIYLARGIAHGFLALEDDVIMHYKVTSTYSPEHDQGILWSSIGVDWPAVEPVVSARDASFASLSKFESPFLYCETGE